MSVPDNRGTSATPPPPPNPRALLREAGLSAKKSWGQNFLCDQTALSVIAEATGCGAEQVVLELGAGLGALTYHLVRRGGRVIAVERDREIVPILRQALLWAENLSIVEADATQMDYREHSATVGGLLAVCGNLPYQLSGRILVNVAEAHTVISRGVFLVQREVAERLAAKPGNRIYGLLSVLVQRAFDVRILRNVPPGAFLPPPKVTSSVVCLSPHRRELNASDADLVATARAAFSARRKMLRNSLADGLSATTANIEAAIGKAGLDARTRAETLSIDDFAKLAASLSETGCLPST
ncbi:MAG: ribosomal RNA small subunit methyltransferase A [Deltaproteobacteria bacterium RIFOXYA12_FULL_58_15]|nr:MAG: ribosomal RNA small subunit methyltransferase A [Deltaproteobacteria bacterium RIFOXYA12_FULL_58_15]